METEHLINEVIMYYVSHRYNYAYSIQKFSGMQMQRLEKDTELPGRSRGTAPAVDLPFLTVYMKVVVYAITQRMLELAVKKLKLHVCSKYIYTRTANT